MRLFGYNIPLTHRDKLQRKRTHNETVSYFAPGNQIFDFAESEILDCEKMISNRLSNVEYYQKYNSLKGDEIFNFIQENRLQLIRRLFTDGYVIVNTRTLEFVDGVCRQVYRSYDGKIAFQLLEDEVLQVSETFEATGLSDFCFLKDKIRFLNIVNSSDMNLIENYGAMGIVSPESDNSVAGAEFSESDIKDLQERYAKHYGITLGKWSLMFVPRPTKYSPISLPIAQLKLEEKRLYLLKAIYAAFGIPKELSVYFENSKYANRREAELDFYSSTITMWADLFTRLIKSIYNNIRTRKEKLTQNEFWYDFVGVFALQEAMIEERERAKDDIQFWRDVATDPEYADTAKERINNILESL